MKISWRWLVDRLSVNFKDLHTRIKILRNSAVSDDRF